MSSPPAFRIVRPALRHSACRRFRSWAYPRRAGYRIACRFALRCLATWVCLAGLALGQSRGWAQESEPPATSETSVNTVAGTESKSDEATGEQLDFFERKIRPVLIQHCYECHSASSDPLQGGLRLDSRDGLRTGGDSGPALSTDDPTASLLLTALRYEDFEMPPDGKLPEAVIRDFEAWVRDGAADPRTSVQAEKLAANNRSHASRPDVEAGRQWWAFLPLRNNFPESGSNHQAARHQASGPSDADTPLVRGIDYFVGLRLAEQGLEAGLEADRRQLLRRLSYDLIGLPPTWEELQRFVADSRPDAFERQVERLLADPRFGERWARPWLDLMRFAEDQAHIVGNNKSLFYPNAFYYRDWVIDAWNRDLGFRDFIRLQLAADLIPDADERDLAALGFMGLGPKYYNRGRLDVQADEWEDRVDVVTRGLLGLTVACARCHDHKYDPIDTEDYYALAGVFASSEMFNAPLPASSRQADQQPQAAQPQSGKKDSNKKTPEETIHIIREGKPRDLNVFIRGDVKRQGAVVPRGFPRVLTSDRRQFATGSGRLELAELITSLEQPLAARVFVNRVWLELFGQGLVATPSNFGRLGSEPSHPELLDHLASEFLEHEGSLKWLVRYIVSSAAYRRSSWTHPQQQEVDPGNRWLARMNPKRLTVEQVRDSVIQAGSGLSRQLGGPSMDASDPESNRRTIYSRISRFELDPLLATFDFPDPNNHAARRPRTTTALQKLALMNHPLIVKQAGLLAEKVAKQQPDVSQRIHRLYEIVLQRSPSPAEVRQAMRFLDAAQESTVAFQASAEARARGEASDPWQQLAQVLLICNEALFVD